MGMQKKLPSIRQMTHRYLRQRRIHVAGTLLAILAFWGLSRGSFRSVSDAESPLTATGTNAPGLLSPENASSGHVPTGPSGRESPAQAAIGQVELAAFESIDKGDEALDADARHCRQVVGVWQDEYQGKREMTVRSDGTATMVVHPSGIGRKLFAERLQFEIEWTLTNGRIVMTTSSGEPEKQTRLVLKLYGNRAEYTLVNLDDQQLLLLDADGKTKYDWRRVKE